MFDSRMVTQTINSSFKAALDSGDEQVAHTAVIMVWGAYVDAGRVPRGRW